MKKLRAIVWLLALGLLPCAQQAWSAAGDIALQPATVTVGTKASFNLDVNADSGTSKVGAYQILITFDPTRLQVDSSVGNSGVTDGADSLSSNIPNLDNAAGTLNIAGINATGVGPGTNLQLLAIAFKSLAIAGDTPVQITVQDFTDELNVTIGTPNGIGSVVTINGLTSQTITFGANPGPVKFVDNGSFTVTATSDNINASAKPVTYTSATPTICSVTPNDGTNTTGVVTLNTTGTCTIAANQASDATHNAATQVTQDVVINPAILQTITFGANPGPVTFSTNGTFTVTATSSDPAGTGNPITFASLTSAICSAASSGTVTILGVGTCTIAANQASDATHSAAPQVTQDIVINPAPQTIIFGANPGPLTFSAGGTFTVTATSSNPTGNPITFASLTPAICSATSGTVTMVSAGTCTIVANQAADATHNAASQVTQDIVINGLTAQIITFGANPGPLTFSAGGTFTVTATSSNPTGNPITFASLTPAICSATSGTVTMVSAGTCTIAANQAADATHNAASQVTQDIVINGLVAQIITFGANPGPLTFSAGGTFTVTATSSNPTGNPITFASLTPAICSATSGTVTMVSAGTCTIAANQAADATHNAASQVTQDIVINGLTAQIITFGANPGPLTFSAGGTFTVTATSSNPTGNPITFASLTPAICSATSGTVTMVSAGTCTIAANQAADATHNAASQVTQDVIIHSLLSQTITSFSATPTNGVVGSNATLSATASSRLTVAFGSSTLGPCTVAGNTVSFLAVGTCIVTADQAGNATYAPASQVTLTIQVRTITYPTATTDTANNIATTSATLNGQVNDNGTSTTVSFDFGLTSSYGDSSPSATPSIINAGSGNTQVTASVSGLTCNTTYHYRVIAVNSAGTIYGGDMNFTTLACVISAKAPTATTAAATNISDSSATLNGQVNDNGAGTTVSFDFGTTTSYDSNLSANPGTISAGSGNTKITVDASGLACGTTYYYRVKAVNSVGTVFGSDANFTTSKCGTPAPSPDQVTAPTGVTQPATAVVVDGAILNALVAANGADTTVRFDFGLTGRSSTAKVAYDTEVAASPYIVNAGTGTIGVTAFATNLDCHTTYHYRVMASNSVGITYGDDVSFTTADCPVQAPPTAITEPPINVTTTSSVLNGQVQDNGTATTVSFNFGLTTSYGTVVAANPSTIAAGAGTTAVIAEHTGLEGCNTTFHYQLKAENSVGVTYGKDISFTTVPCPTVPTVTTGLVTNVTTTGATLNGQVNDNGADTTMSFDVSTITSYSSNTSPTTNVAATPEAIAAGSGLTPLTSTITDKVCNTTYMYRAKAHNSVGTGYGSTKNFTSANCTNATLIATKTGTGDGTVTSSPAGINCGSVCAASFSGGTSVTLTATSANDSAFTGWSGACTDTSTTCTAIMTKNRTVTAAFTAKLASPLLIPEAEATADQDWATISATTGFLDAVVIAGTPSYNGIHPGVARVRNVTSQGFDIKFQEWEYLTPDLSNTYHPYEDIPYLVLEPGRYTMSDGSIWEVGMFDLEGTRAEPWLKTSFKTVFEQTPQLFLTVQTYNDKTAVTVRARNVTTVDFEAALLQEDALTSHHARETIGYLAIYSPTSGGMLSVKGQQMPYLLQTVTDNYRWVPVLSQRLRIEEEQSKDPSIDHVDETLNVLALGSQLFAQQVTDNGADTTAMRRLPPTTDAPMEWGLVRGITDAWLTLPLFKTYTNPVIVATPVSNIASDPGVVRLRNIGSTSAEVRYQEWDYLDGKHSREDVFYMVAEAGKYMLGDAAKNGLQVEANNTDTSALGRADQWDTVNFTATFKDPTVFASVISYVDKTDAAVATRIKDLSTTSFKLAMDEQKSATAAHASETLSWIAIDTGSIATIDGRKLDVFFTNVNQDLTTVSYPQPTSFLFPTVIGQTDSNIELDPVFLRYADPTGAQIRLKLAEDQSKGADVTHAAEKVGVMVGE